MTIRTDIVQRAMRMLNKVGVAADLDPDEAKEALAVYLSMLLTLPAIGLGGPLTDVLISANYTAGEDERITDTSGAAVITKPTTVTDETTGEDRAPRNGAIIQINSATAPTVWIYVAYMGAWKQVTGLTLNSESPFGPMHDEGLAAMLAVRLAGPNTQIPIAVAGMADRGLRDINIRFAKPIISTIDRAIQGRRCR